MTEIIIVVVVAIIFLAAGAWIFKKGYEMGFNAFYRAHEMMPMEGFVSDVEQEHTG